MPKNKFIFIALIFTLLMCLGANFEIEMGTLSFILSDFFVLLAGLVLGAKLASLSVGIYLIMGGLGLPVFAGGGGGLDHLLGNTGGFLFGFLAAAWLSGYLSHRGKFSLTKNLVAALAGFACIFAVGLTWLKYYSHMEWVEVVELAFLPFLVPIGIKVICLLGGVWGMRKLGLRVRGR